MKFTHIVGTNKIRKQCKVHYYGYPKADYEYIDWAEGRLAPLFTKKKSFTLNKWKQPKGTCGKPFENPERIEFCVGVNSDVRCNFLSFSHFSRYFVWFLGT